MIIQISIIGNKHIVFNHFLHYRMTAVFNIDHTSGIDFRTDIIVSGRDQRHGRKHIQCCNGLRGLLDPDHLTADPVSHITEQLIFQRIQLILCSQDHILQLFQLLCDISLCIGKGLFADIIIRNKVFKGIGYLQRISEHTIEFDLQVLDPRTLPLLRLELGKPFFSVCTRTAEGIHILIVSRPDDTAFSLCQRRIFVNRRCDPFCDIRKVVHILIDTDKQRGMKFIQQLLDMRNHGQ